MQEFPPGVELLLSCARACPTPAVANRTRELLGSKIDWAYLLRRAELHGLIPLLYWNLRTISSGLVPSSIMERIKGQFLANAGRNLLLTRKLLEILNLLEANGILAIPFKGPVLASSLYGNLALRTFSDLDILVGKKDITKAKDVLLSSGLQWESQLNTYQKANYLQGDYGCLNFTDKRGRVFLDLERGLSARELPWSFDFERVARRVTRISLEGSMVPAFSPEDLLLILCFHGSKHCWTRLGWVCDLGELIRVYAELNWGKVLEEAAIQGCTRTLLLGLLIAHVLLEVDLPQEVLTKIQSDPVVQSFGHSMVQNLLSDAAPPMGTWALILFYLRLSENFKDQVAYSLRMLFTPTFNDLEILRLPSSLSFLYYFTHPLRLLGKFGSSLIGRPGQSI